MVKEGRAGIGRGCLEAEEEQPDVSALCDYKGDSAGTWSAVNRDQQAYEGEASRSSKYISKTRSACSKVDGKQQSKHFLII